MPILFVKLTRVQIHWTLLAMLVCGQPLLLVASAGSEDWNGEFEIENKGVEVNEGELVFLSPQTERAIHHHHNHIILPLTSLNDGWVHLLQCHKHIDRVPEAQVLFNKSRVRDLTIVSMINIGNAWVEENTVQLRDIHPNATLCVSVFSRSLIANQDGTYSLKNGPFMRRFLDGYYPMHVTMEVEVPSGCLQFLWIMPPQQDGFQVKSELNRVSIDTWFEGRLWTEITFTKTFDRRKKDGFCQL